MASAIIHLAIAKELEKELDIDNKKDYYLGAIAPDISKQLGMTKTKSHILINTKNDVPNIDIFVKRYPYFKYNSFNLGYFIHLYSDKIWFEEFIPKRNINNSIRLLDGTILNVTPEQITDLIYSDYTNLNITVIEKYNLDLSLFYEEFKIPKTTLKEIPIEKLDILINKMGIIIENSKQEKKYIFDITEIDNYIKDATKRILEEIKKY